MAKSQKTSRHQLDRFFELNKQSDSKHKIDEQSFFESLNVNKDLNNGNKKVTSEKTTKKQKKKQATKPDSNKQKPSQTSATKKPNSNKGVSGGASATKSVPPKKSTKDLTAKNKSANTEKGKTQSKQVTKSPAKKPPQRKQPQKKPRQKEPGQDRIAHKNVDFYNPLPFFQNMQAKSAIAIDIDIDKIRYVVVKKASKHYQVKKWGIKRYPSEAYSRHRALQVALANLRKEHYKPGMEVHASIFSPEINIRTIVLPKMKKQSDLDQAIYYKNKQDLKNFNEHSICRHQVVKEFSEGGTEKLKLIVLVVPTDTIQKYLNVFNNVNMVLNSLVPRPVALYYSYRHMIPENSNDLIIDISYDVTQICYVQRGVFNNVRNLSMGSHNFEISIQDKNEAGQDEINAEEIDGGNKPLGKTPDLKNKLRARLQRKIDDLNKKQNPVLHTYFQEILRAISFFQGKDKENLIGRIFITGYGLKKESLVPYIRSRLNMPVYLLSPQFEAHEDDALKNAEYYTAIGTVLQKNHNFNLLTRDYKQKTMFRKLNFLLGFLIVLSVAGLGYHHILQKDILRQKTLYYKQLENEYYLINPIEGKYKELQERIRAVNSRNSRLRSYLKDVPPIIEVMKLFSNETPSSIQLTRLAFSLSEKDMKNSENKIRYEVDVEGLIKGSLLMSDVMIIDYINQLNKLGYFEEIVLNHKRKIKEEETTRFGFTAKM
ncbi:MAG: hypothetical protein GF313_02580 [Caldithrix sp.]|nr:hypothetical protein [Caldithrix sp.]